MAPLCCILSQFPNPQPVCQMDTNVLLLLTKNVIEKYVFFCFTLFFFNLQLHFVAKWPNPQPCLSNECKCVILVLGHFHVKCFLTLVSRQFHVKYFLIKICPCIGLNEDISLGHFNFAICKIDVDSCNTFLVQMFRQFQF